MTTLEDVAKWHDSEATVLEALAAQSGFGKDCAYAWAAIKHRASAAACRELADKKAAQAAHNDSHGGGTPGVMDGYCDVALEAATDAALAEIE